MEYHDSMDLGETPKTQLAEIAIQAGVVCAAERLHARMQRVSECIRKKAEAHRIAFTGEHDFSDFFNALAVRGMVAYAPFLLELEREFGLVCPLSDQDINILRRTVATEIKELGQAMELLNHGTTGQTLGKLACMEMTEAASLLTAAAKTTE